MKVFLLACWCCFFSMNAFAQALPPLPTYNSSLLLESSIDRVIQKIYDDLLQVLQPVAGKISSEFGSRLHPLSHVLRHHNGIDVACPVGSEVRAVLPGRVKLVAQQGGYGKLIELSHAGELTASRYAHLSSFAVREGQRVKKGEIIGFSGQTGRVTGPHLHFELFQAGKAVDPKKFFDVWDSRKMAGAWP